MTETVEEVQSKIEQLECRWMTGSGGQLPPDLLPLQWQPLIAHRESEQQALFVLALYSQHQAMLFEPEATTELTKKADLPELDMPCLPAGIRPCFRRVLEAIKPYTEIKTAQVLQLLQQRGVSAHPADWLPSSQDVDLPSMYQPWCSWALSHQTSELTAQTWDDFYPADRLRLLRALRMKDPQIARDLIQLHAFKESAEKRLKIVEVLTVNLSKEDSSFLQSLTKNRSQKVALLAKQYLARLESGQQEVAAEEVSEQAQDLAETFEFKKTGLLKKGCRLFPVKLKSKKQQAIRSELLEKIPLSVFAQALDIELQTLLASWQFANNRDHDNQKFVVNAVNTLSDTLFPVLLKNILKQLAKDQSKNQYFLSLIPFFFPRMQADDRANMMLDFLAMKSLDFSFSDCLAYTDKPLNALDWKMLVKTSAWKKLVKELHEENKEKCYVDNYYLTSELIALGLLGPHPLAVQALESLVATGLQQADPALESLKLNIQLAPPSNQESQG